MNTANDIVKRIGNFLDTVEMRLNSVDNRDYVIVSNIDYDGKNVSMLISDRGVHNFNASININGTFILVNLTNKGANLGTNYKCESTIIEFDSKEDMVNQFNVMVKDFIKNII